jgi:hypothetical protein
MSGLLELKLDGTAITDEGLAQLAGLKSLRVLDLGGTDVTFRGILALRPQERKIEMYAPVGITLPVDLDEAEEYLVSANPRPMTVFFKGLKVSLGERRSRNTEARGSTPSPARAGAPGPPRAQ